MALELAGASYTFVQPDWPADKEKQLFGRFPRLTIKSSDGTTKELWESFAIETYLGEKLGFLSTNPFKRAESISILRALAQLHDEITSTSNLPVEQRGETHKKHISETIPKFLKYHEAILAKSSGPYYAGQVPTLPDFTLLSLYVRYKDMYGDECPITTASFPNILVCVDALLTTAVGEYVKNKRQQNFMWSKESFSWKRK